MKERECLQRMKEEAMIQRVKGGGGDVATDGERIGVATGEGEGILQRMKEGECCHG
jgi:hypothetical protein